MKISEVEKRMDTFCISCKKNGLRRTPQKEVIYRILAETTMHPTAQEIYQAAQIIFPNISFATVYKNLSLFQKHKIIQELDFGEGVSRYDAFTEEHHHIYDTSKKIVTDVFIKKGIPIPNHLSQINIKKINITYFI